MLRYLAGFLALNMAFSPFLSADPAAPSPLLGVLVVDSNRRWDPDTQAHFGASKTDLKTLLKPQVVSKLSFEQRKALLRDPARLLASSRAQEILAVDRVLVLEPSLEDRVLATFVDLRTNQTKRLISPKNMNGEEAREALMAMAGDEAGPNAAPVAANPESRLYHRVGAAHTNPRASLESYPSLVAAEAKGFQPCHICFVETNRMLAHDDLERELGKALASQVEQEYPVSLDPVKNERVQRIGRRLVEKNHLLDQGYRFVVLDSDEINAFAVPTGPLYVTRGLLEVVETDAELATILGHELSHAELHHSRKQYEQMQQLSWLALLATIATGTGWAYYAANFFGTLVSRGYSREFEMEADRQGMWMAFGAGYDPEDFRLTLQKFKDLEKVRPRGGIEWFHTHPGSDDRIAQVNGILDRLEPMGLVLEEVTPVDPGLADYLRGHGSEFLDDPVEVVSFLNAYRALNLPAAAPAGAPGAPGSGLPDIK